MPDAMENVERDAFGSGEKSRCRDRNRSLDAGDLPLIFIEVSRIASAAR
jgi:hypothetical protein